MIIYVYGFKDSCGSGFKAGLSYLSNNSFLFPFPLENSRLFNLSVIIVNSAFSSEKLEKQRPFKFSKRWVSIHLALFSTEDFSLLSLIKDKKDKKDVEIVKTTITHPDVEYVYTGSDIVIDSKVDSISPILLKKAGEYIVSFNVDSNYYESIPFKVTILPKTVQLKLDKYQKYVGEKDPVLETENYILTREVGEDVGNYKLTAKSKSRKYKYEIIENDMFTILENKAQQIKPEATNHPSNGEKKEPLQSVNVSNKDKNKYADASDKNTNINTEAKANKESAKTEAKVVTGVYNLTAMYLSLMTISLVVVMYILIKKSNVKS